MALALYEAFVKLLMWHLLIYLKNVDRLLKPYRSNFRGMFGESPSLTIKRKAMRHTSWFDR